MPRYVRPTKSKEQHLSEYNAILSRNLPRMDEIDREREIPKKFLHGLYKEKTALSQEIRTKEAYCKKLGYL
jgi:hypothetical protein